MENIYKEASKIGLRFQTTKGPLSVEQLWDLPMTVLADCIKLLKKMLKTNEDDELAFLDTPLGKLSEEDKQKQLAFEILKDIYLTKKQEAEDKRNAKETKEHNQKILQLIADKKDKDLEGKSIEELEAMLK